jgi:hypothetical protein
MLTFVPSSFEFLNHQAQSPLDRRMWHDDFIPIHHADGRLGGNRHHVPRFRHDYGIVQPGFKVIPHLEHHLNVSITSSDRPHRGQDGRLARERSVALVRKPARRGSDSVKSIKRCRGTNGAANICGNADWSA